MINGRMETLFGEFLFSQFELPLRLLLFLQLVLLMELSHCEYSPEPFSSLSHWDWTRTELTLITEATETIHRSVDSRRCLNQRPRCQHNHCKGLLITLIVTFVTGLGISSRPHNDTALHLLRCVRVGVEKTKTPVGHLHTKNKK